MKKVASLGLIALGAGIAVTLAVTGASADEPTPAPSTTTTSVVTTLDSESGLLVATIDEHTIEVSRPD